MQSRDFVIGLVISFLLGMLLTYQKPNDKIPAIEKRLEKLEASAK